MKKFPNGFLWGASTAAFQVEGGIENCDWADAARLGREPVCGRACDHYNLFEQDFDIAKSLSHNAHKISIEWARIEPEEGKFDMAAVEHYTKVLQAISARGMKPVINIWHFTLPSWFANKGAFTRAKNLRFFARYAAFCAKHFAPLSNMWITINEPMVYAGGGYLRGQWPPFRHNPIVYLRVISNLIRAHIIAAQEIKKVDTSLQVGIAKNNIYFHANKNPLNILQAKFMNWFWNTRFLDAIDAHQDFVGINYYFHKKFGDTATYEKTEMNWDIYPEGLYRVLLEVKRYNKPTYVVENGLADYKDEKRGAFIISHIDAVHRALQAGVDMRGYFHWSLLDNYEWAFGFDRHFGLVKINYETMAREIRPSAYIYKKICDANALEM